MGPPELKGTSPPPVSPGRLGRVCQGAGGGDACLSPRRARHAPPRVGAVDHHCIRREPAAVSVEEVVGRRLEASIRHVHAMTAMLRACKRRSPLRRSQCGLPSIRPTSPNQCARATPARPTTRRGHARSPVRPNEQPRSARRSPATGYARSPVRRSNSGGPPPPGMHARRSGDRTAPMGGAADLRRGACTLAGPATEQRPSGGAGHRRGPAAARPSVRRYDRIRSERGLADARPAARPGDSR
jgi:hypothetical protein